ncbi:acetate and sugar kinases/Hsc70/actin family protein [Halobacterium rubrum]|uniref:rod shape-determining protein n=1 Tax=Halobacterium TaxID=2239 RepID=UPI001F3FB572|nr:MULTISPECIES: rod shape-determining protein [Halobacterium]MDH5020245.1 rod shape-determining protein [Halobacterium rubrum]
MSDEDEATDDGGDDGEERSAAEEMEFGDQPSALGVKVGSTRTVVAAGDASDPDVTQTLTCLATYDDALTGEEHVIYGEEAATEYPDRVRYMLRSGLPEDEETTGLAKRFFEEFAAANGLSADSVVVYAIPTIDNEAGLARLAEIIEDGPVGERRVASYPESLCGAVPALGDGLDAIEDTFVAVNMGSTNLEACAYRRGEQLAPFSTGAVTGSEVDRRIANYVEEETQGRVNIDLTTAREYKEDHADFEDYEPFSDIIQQPGGGTYEFTIEDAVMDAVDEFVDDAVNEVANIFMPEFANDYMKVYQQALDNPVVLTGGMACIPGIVGEFEDRLSEEVGREVEATTADRPETAAARGAHRIAERLVDLGEY